MKQLRAKHLLFAAAAAIAIIAGSAPLFSAAPSPLDGVWEGTFDPPDLPIDVRFTFDGATAVMDVPGQAVLWYPVSLFGLKDGKLELKVAIGANPIILTATLAGDELKGGFVQGVIKGGFSAKRTSGPLPGVYRVPVKRGDIFGRLLLPPASGAKPSLAILVAASGPTNLDGNNAGFGGPNDCLRMLAEGLSSSGVASYRFDKRGVGMSAGLIAKESDLVYGDYVDDLAAIVARFRADGRFGKVIVVGHGEGSLVGMAAARRTKADGFISLEGAGYPMYETLAKQLVEDPPEIQAEAAEIMKALKEGKKVDKVSDALAPLFRASLQAYLISWFSYVPASEIADLTCPVLLVRGDKDLQISPEDFEVLKRACPSAIAQVFSGMNNVLKEVKDDPTDNYYAYRDPSRPLADGLVDAIAGFVKGIR